MTKSNITNRSEDRESEFDVIVIGGGFYGCCLAIVLRNIFDKILILEREPALLMRASLINQARVHAGYHYPRSLVTAIRSFVNFPQFVSDFPECICDDFEKIYAIARNGSKVNAYQFGEIYKRIGAPIKLAPKKIRRLFNMDQIEEVFSVKEVAFDASKLRNALKDKLHAAGIEVRYNYEVHQVEQLQKDKVRIRLSKENLPLVANQVFNCTYSQINNVLKRSGVALLPLKHEITEMPLLELPDDLKNIAITIMDGPFFSIMPYPSLKLHSLHHVRYTPHFSWQDMEQFIDGNELLKGMKLKSRFTFMLKDAQRYIPCVKDVKYVDSLYEVKTVLIRNEIDDGRPILFKKDYGIKNFSTIMGGKLDNIYDVLEMVTDTKGFMGGRSGSLFSLGCQ